MATKTTGKCETCGKETCELDWACDKCGNLTFYIAFTHGKIVTTCDFCGEAKPLRMPE